MTKNHLSTISYAQVLPRLICAILLTMAVGTANAQRIGCVHASPSTRAALPLADEFQLLPNPVAFDSQTTYRQPVVLITFSDTEFSMPDPATFYNRLFNEKGFNEGMGPGCVADYFRDQSEGRLNLQFDIYGPIKVDVKAGGHRGVYTGYDAIGEALETLCDTEQTDFAIYDWDGDSVVNQVLFVAAGFTGNQKTGYLWPNSGYSFYSTPGGMKINYTSISCELLKDSTSCGIGTIIHEFLHCLGLPDIYPFAPAKAYSTVDEWDIMDGGNFTNKGWCPPNLSAMEKMYLGWAQPVELTESTSIQDMQPVSAGGDTYIIRNTGNNDEFYLLENRQQEGWDYGCPGKGLLIFHVDYLRYDWCNNYVNVSDDHYRYDLFHADGRDYMSWNPANNDTGTDKWTMSNALRSRYLSTSPYPYTDPTTLEVNDSLTDHSSPAATLFTANAEGKTLMGKTITNIQMSEDGTISFDFMKTDLSGLHDLATDKEAFVVGWYDLEGRKLSTPPHHPGVYITLYSDGTKKKCLMTGR